MVFLYIYIYIWREKDALIYRPLPSIQSKTGSRYNFLDKNVIPVGTSNIYFTIISTNLVGKKPRQILETNLPRCLSRTVNNKLVLIYYQIVKPKENEG